MKKIVLGITAAFALATVAPAFANEGAAAPEGDKPAVEKKAPKKAKAKKGTDEKKPEGDAAGKPADAPKGDAKAPAK